MIEIPLRNKRGVVVALARVDDDDAPGLIVHRWCLHGEYAYRGTTVNGRTVGVFMHREILTVAKGTEVDHADGDPLNNQRSNLRTCSRAQNMQNLRRPRTNTSGIKGVSFCRFTGRWSAAIRSFGMRRFLGRFPTKEAAGAAYRAAAKELHGRFARADA